MKYLKFLPAVAGVFLLASCELEEQIEPAEETYTKAFIKEFGIIDPKQDWNMATRGSVTVNTPSATEVKIYGKSDNGKYRMVADFGGVSGTKTLAFDIPRGMSDILVSGGGYAGKTTVGGNVNFANISTRSAITNDNDGKTAVKVAYVSDYDVKTYNFVKEITFKENTNDTENPENCTGVYRYQQTLPETKWNVEAEGVSKNFHFKSDGKPFVVYPVYWETGATVEVGIAYRTGDDVSTEEQVPVYTVKSGDELMTRTTYSSNQNITWNATINVEGTNKYIVDLALGEGYYDKYNNSGGFKNLTEDDKKSLLNYYKNNIETLGSNYKSFDEYTDVTLDAEQWGGVWTIYVNGKIYNDWEKITSFPSAPKQSKEGTQYKSRGIEVTVPEGLDYCFYIKNGDKTMYTRQEWNTDNYVTYDATSKKKDTDKTQRALHGATYTVTETTKDKDGNDISTKTRCLAFEDWYNIDDRSDPDVDLNDLVFYTTLAVDDPDVIIEEDDPITWILAAEDLGNMDDFDFNDMVIGVSTPKLKSGSTDKYEVTVTPLAAGGTLPIKLCRNNGTTTEVLTSPANKSEQFHAWFGEGNISTGTMINTSSFNSSLCKNKYTFEVGATTDASGATSVDFTMASYSEDVTGKMGGFSFKVDRTGSDDESSYTTEIQAPNDGDAPQMICVPGDWKWPTERTHINEAYPNNGGTEATEYGSGLPGFKKWCEDYTNQTWVGSAVEGKVISH